MMKTTVMAENPNFLSFSRLCGSHQTFLCYVPQLSLQFIHLFYFTFPGFPFNITEYVLGGFSKFSLFRTDAIQ